MNFIRKLLLPIVPIYFMVTWLRNIVYDLGWKSSKSYNLPIICVGNLSTGGTGKTPMIEYLIRLLKDNHQLAVLSRGYGRKTKGFILADMNASAETIGDEPFQFYKKFKDHISVAVDENRQQGIDSLRTLKSPEIILLDDAFQHRKVKAGFNIILTAYDQLYCDDIVLPTGNLREPKSGAKRADVILVTKCPLGLSSSEKERITKRLKPLEHQSVYFSTISYSDTIFNGKDKRSLEQLTGKKVTLVTGIANATPLLVFLKSKAIDFEHLNFKDHHVFSASEIETLKQKEFILTTEKDFMRLQADFNSDESSLYYLPIRFKIDHQTEFDNMIKTFIASN